MDKKTANLIQTGAYLQGFWILGLIGFVCSIICLVVKKDKDMKTNGIQGLTWAITVWILRVVLWTFLFGSFGLGFMFGFPAIAMVLAGISWIFTILVTIYSIYMAIQIYNGKKVKIPLLYNLIVKKFR